MSTSAVAGAARATGRNLPLDGLRGVVALLVVAYHFIYSLELPVPAWLQATGLMGVDAFFVLSGYALARVYWGTDFTQLAAATGYAQKRVMRIAPLLFLATVATAAPESFLPLLVTFGMLWCVLKKQAVWLALTQSAALLLAIAYAVAYKPDVRLLPSLTLLWGFVDPTLSIAGGSWSIGVELVFYCAFPLILIAMRWRRWLLVLLLLASVIAGVAYQHVYSTALLSSKDDLGLVVERWRNYVAVPHHAYFFVAGIALHAAQQAARQAVRVAVRTWGLVLLVTLYAALPAWGMPDHGLQRVWYALITVGIVAGIALLEDASLGARQAWVLRYLGEISYAAYMLHFPILALLYPHVAPFLTPWQEVAFCFMAVLLVTPLVRIVFERTFDAGRLLTSSPAGLPSRPPMSSKTA